MHGRGDPGDVGKTNEHLLRRWLACRRAGDHAAAHALWPGLCEQLHDFVVTWCRTKGRVAYGLSPEERDDAAQIAMEKVFARLPETFRGESMGELINAALAAADFGCREAQRRAARVTGRSAPLEVVGEDGDRRLADGVAAKVREDDEAARAEADDEAAELERLERGREFLAWALGQLDERQRVVVERSRQGADAAAIAAELGVTMDNLYQLRSRAMKAVRKLKEQWDG